VATTFSDRISELRDLVHSREGRITASVVVDQAYAHYQHERLDLHHPRGGRAKYLEGPLHENYADYLRAYAREVLRDGGEDALWRSAEHLSDQVEIHAPREWGDLHKSGHPRLLTGGSGEADSGRVTRDREPKVQRLTKQELRAKSRAIMRARLAAGLTVYFFRHGKIMVIPGKNEPHPPRGRL
jgi:hypothetical protein